LSEKEITRDIKVFGASALASVDAFARADANVLAGAGARASANASVFAFVFLSRNHGVNPMPAIKVSRVPACANVVARASANASVFAIA
jgi:hypothetical protein